MTKFKELKKTLLERTDVRVEYDALAEEFSIAEARIRACAKAGVTPG